MDMQKSLQGGDSFLTPFIPSAMGAEFVSGHGGPSQPRRVGGVCMPPLLGRLPLQLIEDQAALLLEYAQRPFERMEHRLSNHRGVASI